MIYFYRPHTKYLYKILSLWTLAYTRGIPTVGQTRPYLCDGYEHISYGEGGVKLEINRKDITMNKITNNLLLVGPHKIIVGISIK